MEKKRVAIINSVYRIGSTGRICFELQNYLEEHGYDCCTFYGRNNQSLSNSYYFGNKLDLILHGVRSRITDKHGLYSKHQTKKLINKLDEYSPDIYIIHNLHGYYVNYDMLLKYISRKGVPILLVFHDCWNFTGHCAHFSFNRCNKWKSGCEKCRFINSYPKSYLLGDSSLNYKNKEQLINKITNITIISPSVWLAKTIKQSFLGNLNIRVINNGINTKQFKKKVNPAFRNKYHLEKYKLILCVAYIFDKKKGIDDVVQLSKMIDDDYKIVVVGKTKRIRIKSNIIHVNKTSDVNELIDIYSSCDVFFNPTYEDTYSNVNMEALSCGLPVISYDSCGAAEMIQKPFVVEKGDLKTAWHLMKKIVDEGIAYSFDNVHSFSKDIMYSQYELLIKDLIK